MDTKVNAAAVYQDRTSAALAVIAALFGTRKVQMFAQRVEQRDARVEGQPMLASVDLEADGAHHRRHLMTLDGAQIKGHCASRRDR